MVKNRCGHYINATCFFQMILNENKVSLQNTKLNIKGDHHQITFFVIK